MESSNKISLSDFQCGVHLDIMDDPVTLMCGHNICKGCAETIMNRNTKTITCPFDRKQNQYPLGINSLNVNIQMKQMIELIKQLNGVRIENGNEEIKKYLQNTFMNKSEMLVVDEVIDITNEALQIKFNKLQQNIRGDKKIIRKLHGTYESNLQGIKEKGFLMPSTFQRSASDQEGDLTFGKAIYFSTYSSKVVNYGDRLIIISDIILGRVKTMNSSQANIDSNFAQQNQFDSIYYEQQQSDNPDICKGSLTDEYAIFNSDQILPRFAVKYHLANAQGQLNKLEYKQGWHTLQNTNIQLLIKCQQSSFQNQIANLILGDLSRDFTTGVVKSVLTYEKQFFYGINYCLMSDNEQVVLHALRVLWNSSYNQRLMQYKIVQNLHCQIFFQILKSTHSSVLERCAGVLQNLSQLEKENAEIFVSEKLLDVLFKMFQKVQSQQSERNLRCNLIGAIANILKFCPLNKKDPKVQIIIDNISELMDDNRIGEEVIRLISNQIGFGQEWVEEGYKSSIGQSSI